MIQLYLQIEKKSKETYYDYCNTINFYYYDF